MRVGSDMALCDNVYSCFLLAFHPESRQVTAIDQSYQSYLALYEIIHKNNKDNHNEVFWLVIIA